MLFGFIPIPNIALAKVGVGGSWMDRLKGVSRTLNGFVIPIFIVWIPGAYYLEKWIHRKMKVLNVPYFGSGRTEWFWIVVAAFAIPVMASAFAAFAGSLLFVVSYAVDGENGAYRALKWLSENWRLFLVWVGMGKVMVIFGQMIMRR